MHQSAQCTISQAATILGTTRWTVRRWVIAGDLIAEKIGHVWILDRADVHRRAEDLNRADLARIAARSVEPNGNVA